MLVLSFFIPVVKLVLDGFKLQISLVTVSKGKMLKIETALLTKKNYAEHNLDLAGLRRLRTLLRVMGLIYAQQVSLNDEHILTTPCVVS